MNFTSAIGGFAGACALTLINESLKKADKDAPRLDLLGMNAVAKIVKSTGLNAATGANSLLPIALSGDLLSNALYFGMADAPDKKGRLIRGTVLGLAAGVGAVTLAKPLGLDTQTVNRTAETTVLTIAYYLAGGLVAATVMNMLDNDAQPSATAPVTKELVAH